MAHYVKVWSTNDPKREVAPGKRLTQLRDYRLSDAQPGDIIWVIAVQNAEGFLLARFEVAKVRRLATKDKQGCELDAAPETVQETTRISLAKHRVQVEFQTTPGNLAGTAHCESGGAYPRNGEVIRGFKTGWQLTTKSGEILEQLWDKGTRKKGGAVRSPSPSEQESSREVLLEGALVSTPVSAYERSPLARKRCIEHYGSACFVCGFDFGKEFGSWAKGFIHVHHETPLSQRGKEYAVDPVKDLKPVCPNCHAMLHYSQSPPTVTELARQISAGTEHSPANAKTKRKVAKSTRR